MSSITVHGAGIFGLACAFEMARRGAKVTVVDPGGPGAGSSGGTVGALAPHVPENWNPKKAFQLESLLAAEDFWAEVARIGGGVPGYGRVGRLQPLADDRAVALARARIAGAEALWQGRATWAVRPVSDFGDWCPQSATGFVVHDTLSARLHPKRACDALARAITALGGTLATEAPEGSVALWATGHAGLATLSAALDRPIGSGVKGQSATLKLSAPEAPQIYTDGLYIVPHADGTTGIGSTSERDFTAPQDTDDQLDALIARARAALPALDEAEVLTRWAGVRPRAKSRAPMLGPWPDRPGYFIANGGFKIGFGMAVGVARTMADLILDGRDTVPEGFRVTDNL